MSFRRKIFSAMLVVLGAGLGSQALAQPLFENNTPTGFSVSDSTSKVSFVNDNEVTVQVDLSQPGFRNEEPRGRLLAVARPCTASSTPRASTAAIASSTRCPCRGRLDST